MTLDIKAEAQRYAKTVTDHEREHIADFIPQEQLSEFLTLVANCEETKPNIKQKITSMLHNLKHGLSTVKEKETWDGFDDTVQTFSGEYNDIDVNQWIFAIDKYVRNKVRKYDIPDEEIAHNVVTRLKAAPYNVYRIYEHANNAR